MSAKAKYEAREEAASFTLKFDKGGPLGGLRKVRASLPGARWLGRCIYIAPAVNTRRCSGVTVRAAVCPVLVLFPASAAIRQWVAYMLTDFRLDGTFFGPRGEQIKALPAKHRVELHTRKLEVGVLRASGVVTHDLERKSASLSWRLSSMWSADGGKIGRKEKVPLGGGLMVDYKWNCSFSLPEVSEMLPAQCGMPRRALRGINRELTPHRPRALCARCGGGDGCMRSPAGRHRGRGWRLDASKCRQRQVPLFDRGAGLGVHVWPGSGGTKARPIAGAELRTYIYI